VRLATVRTRLFGGESRTIGSFSRLSATGIYEDERTGMVNSMAGETAMFRNIGDFVLAAVPIFILILLILSLL
jgi:hypothetical protein